MGIVMGFTRVTAEQYARADLDPEFLGAILQAERPEEESVYLDKAVPDLDRLLQAADVPVLEFATGGMPLELPDGEMAWGWSVEDVQEAAEHLRAVPFDRLAAHWDKTPEEFAYLRYYYENLVRFLVATAEAGSAAILGAG
jgi:hypothetical protein